MNKRIKGSRLVASKDQDYIGEANITIDVRDGRRYSHIVTILPMLEITTSAGILMGILRVCGAIPLTLTLNWSIVQFPFALL